MEERDFFGEEKSQPFRKIPRFIIVLIFLAAVAIYFATGLFVVGPAEVGLVKVFGKHTTTAMPGLRYHLPFPMGSVAVVNTASLRKEEIGFETVAPGRYIIVEQEALMLTGDGNIVSVELVVQYYVGEPEKYAFEVVPDTDIIKFTSEAILREEVAASTIDAVLTVERESISARVAERIQEEFDSMGIGLLVQNAYMQEASPPRQTIAAFDDVNNARQDRTKFTNDAERYRNDIVPQAHGEAASITRAAEAYAAQKVLGATGDTERFINMLREYEIAPEITRTRLYLEMLESVLVDSEKTVVTGAEGLFRFLDLTPDERGIHQ